MRKVIYTCITNKYDSLLDPIVIDSEYDYICFVKKGTLNKYKSKVWSFREIPYTNNNERILSRYVKINPHIVLSEYNYSLYIDGNVSIATSEIYDIINTKINNKVIYSGIKHWGRDCAYEEAYACINARKDSFLNIIKTIKFLKSKRFPSNYGLFENNVIFRMHNNNEIVRFSNMWWYYYLKYSHRDQLIHSYCLKECDIKIDYLFTEAYCARNHDTFIYKKHEGKQKKITKYNYLIRKSKVLLAKVLQLLFI